MNHEAIKHLKRVQKIARWTPRDEEVAFSVSYLPHEWPSQVVAILAYRGSVLQLTIEPDVSIAETYEKLEGYAEILIARTLKAHKIAARRRKSVFHTPDGSN